MVRKENESYLGYVHRCTEALDNGIIDYKEWGDYILGCDNNYSSDNLRKMSYGIKKMLPKFDGDITITDNDMLKNIQLQKDELYKEKVKLQDERRMKNNNLRIQARYENLVDIMVDAISCMPEFKLKETKINTDSNVEACLDFSDFHYGLLVDNVLNYYDTQVAKERVEILADKVKYYCSLHRVNKLHMNLLGDLISGVIKIQHKVDAEEDVIIQIMNCSELISEFINSLHSTIPNIEVYGVIGNHSRLQMDKKMNMPSENFERLIFKFIQLRLPNVKVHLNGIEDWQTYKIKDKELFITHGDKDSLSNVKSHVVDLLNRTVDEIHMGHIHHFNIKDDNGTEIIVNGSVISTDDYAMSIRCNTPPYQILRIYDKDICTYKLELNH